MSDLSTFSFVALHYELMRALWARSWRSARTSRARN